MVAHAVPEEPVMVRSLFAPIPVAIAALLLSMPFAHATPSRVVGLGDMGRYVLDDSNVLFYPGLMPTFGNFVYVDLGGPAGISPTLSEVQTGGLNAGAFLGLTEKLHLGIVASDYIPAAHSGFLSQVASGANSANQGVFGDLAGAQALRRYDVLMAYRLSPEWSTGLRLSYGSRAERFTPDENSLDSRNRPRLPDRFRQDQLRVVAGASGNAGTVPLDFAMDYTRYGLSYVKSGDEPFVGGGGHAFGVTSRARMPLFGAWDLVPQASYRLSNFGMLEDSFVPEIGGSNQAVERFDEEGQRTHQRTTHELDFGAAAVFKVNTKTNFWFASGIQWMNTRAFRDVAEDEGLNERRDSRTNFYALPYFKLAVETAPFEWMRLRAAAEKFSWRATQSSEHVVRGETATTVRTSSSQAVPSEVLADFNAYLGASFLFQGFVLDLLLDNDFLRRGPSIISGRSGDLALRASLGYTF